MCSHKAESCFASRLWILTEEEEGHFDEFFAQLACCCAHGRAIWETYGESRRKLTRWVCKFQGVVLFLEDVKSRFALPLTAVQGARLGSDICRQSRCARARSLSIHVPWRSTASACPQESGVRAAIIFSVFRRRPPQSS